MHDVRVFLGLANFYRRFIKNFSKVASPITTLLKKDRRFQWTPQAQKAFAQLKEVFTSAPILRHFDPSLPTVMEADASDYALGAVISQRDPLTGVLHPVAFYSRKFNPAELNYEIYDKEMLAIVETMDRYRHYFEGLGQKTTVFSDHRNLLWFTETKVYNRRQARWAEKLSRFDFAIVFRPGKQGGKPDAISRRPDYTLGDNKEERTMTFLKPEQLGESSVTSYTLNNMVVESLNMSEGRSEALQEAISNDPQIGPYFQYLRDPEMHRDDAVAEYLRPFFLGHDGLVLREGLIYVPEGNELKIEILRECHDSRIAGHMGQEKTLELVTRNYYWPKMRQFVNEYVKTCDTCARNKTPRRAPYGKLKPLPIPEGPWQSVSMDFIVELPPSNGFDAIYVCVDRLTKMAHFCPTRSNVTAEQTAQLYLQYVFKNHGLPVDIISDRGSQFISHFTRRLLELCEVTGNRSTAYHPQSDGQTERVNQTLEQYLRIYCDYQQDDWSQLLPLAEFVYNNAQHASTRVSPFFANYGYHPRGTIKMATDSINPSAEALADKLRNTHQELRTQIKKAQATYKGNYDRHTKEPPTFEVGDKVWLNRKNIRTTRPSQKLDCKRMGPFPILEVVGESKSAYKLELPPQMRIHPVFHVSLLDTHRPNTIPERTQPPPPPEEVLGELEYEVERILDSRWKRGRRLYLVDWKGYSPEERTWEPEAHLEGAAEAIAEYHRHHPHAAASLPPRGPRGRRKVSRNLAGARP